MHVIPPWQACIQLFGMCAMDYVAMMAYLHCSTISNVYTRLKCHPSTIQITVCCYFNESTRVPNAQRKQRTKHTFRCRLLAGKGHTNCYWNCHAASSALHIELAGVPMHHVSVAIIAILTKWPTCTSKVGTK